MGWLIGAVLVVLVGTAAVTGLHLGPHGLFGPVLAVGLAVAWFAVAAGLGATSGTAWWLAGTCAAACAVSVAVAVSGLRGARLLPPPKTPAALIGSAGRAMTDLDPVGVVQIGGESWTAESLSGRVSKGAEVRIVSLDGMRLRVWSEEGEPWPLES